MTGAPERRCTLRAPAPRTLARPHVRMSNVPLGCVSDRQRHIQVRGDVHLHTKVRRLSQWAQCTHFQRVHALLHVHTRSGCGIPGRRAVLSWSPQLLKKRGKLVNHNLNPVSTCSIHSSASVESRPPPWSSMQQRLAVCCLLGIRVLRPLGHRREAPTRCQVMPP